MDLLDRVALGEEDQLLFVGDLVARGPDSAGVLDLAAELGGRAVLGNHERRLLQARAASGSKKGGPRLGPSAQALLASLETRHWKQLETFPLHLDLPEHGVRIVHAGLVPRVPIEQQDPWVLTHIRSLLDDGSPSDKRGATLWASRYREEPHVVFGHNAVDGLQMHPSATGLDTACVYGRELSALVLEEGDPPPPLAQRVDAVVSVRARKAYVAL
jgi:hypothetical protein